MSKIIEIKHLSKTFKIKEKEKGLKGSLKEIVYNSDLIFLAGGDTLEEIKFYNDIKLRDIIKDYNGVIMGQSAGSINLAYDVYNSLEKESDLLNSFIWKGLCKTNINIEPHFIYDDSNFNNLEKIQRKEVLKESYNRTLYGFLDGSYIYQNNDKKLLYGKAYEIKNGIIKEIGNNKETIELWFLFIV